MLLVTTVLVGCGGASAPRPVVPAVAPGPLEPIGALAPKFFAGETIVWKVTFAGVEGGRARLAVGAPGLVDGRNVVILSAQAESSGLFAAIKQVNDDVTSWIDVAAGTPVRTESTTNLGGTRTIAHVVHQPTHADVTLWRKDKETKRKIHFVGSPTHDAMSSLLMLRAWEAPVGARGLFYTLGGRTLWSTELTVESKETIDTPLGPRRTIRITGVSQRINRSRQPYKQPRSFTVWLTDDAERIPVRIVAKTEYGDIVVTAEAYTR